MKRIYQYNELPVPRLELRWEPISPDDEDGYTGTPQRFNWRCCYELILHAPPGDIRHYEGQAKNMLHVTMGGPTQTYRHDSPHDNIEKSGIDTPFRDGVHIMRDAAQLRLPAFAVCNGEATAIEPLWSEAYRCPVEC